MHIRSYRDLKPHSPFGKGRSTMGGHTENHTIKTERKGLGLNSQQKMLRIAGSSFKIFPPQTPTTPKIVVEN